MIGHLRPRPPDDPAESSAALRGDAERTPKRSGEAAEQLDPAALAGLIALDPSGRNRLVVRVLQTFQSSVARLRPQLVAGRRSGDLDAIQLVAHTLKSSSASIGALRLAQVCSQVEATIRLAAEPIQPTQLDALDRALDSALQAIERVLEERA